jgi:cell division protein FtsB
MKEGRGKWKDWSLRILFVALFVFAVVSNIIRIINNNELSEKVRNSTERLENLKAKAKKLELLSTYYQSVSYQEVEARRRLGMQKPDEKVIIIKGIPIDSTNNLESLNNGVEQPVADVATPNTSKWWKYFFGKR